MIGSLDLLNKEFSSLIGSAKSTPYVLPGNSNACLTVFKYMGGYASKRKKQEDLWLITGSKSSRKKTKI